MAIGPIEPETPINLPLKGEHFNEYKILYEEIEQSGIGVVFNNTIIPGAGPIKAANTELQAACQTYAEDPTKANRLKMIASAENFVSVYQENGMNSNNPSQDAQLLGSIQAGIKAAKTWTP
jgi:hypothetical protein